jgi:hypothetical protein
MTESAVLERRYRRLLAWYPRQFRCEHEDEMLAVLMASAREGQRRPGLLETADVIRSALGMRLLRALSSGRENRRWTDALALFSILAHVFVVLVVILEVALPYHLPPRDRSPFLFHMPGPITQIGGLSLLRVPFLDIAVGFQVIVAAFALLGRRRMTLIAMAASTLYWILYWAVFRYGISGVPDALQLLAAGAYVLGAAAFLASPGPPRGRHLMNWRHWAALLPAAALVQVLTLISDARSRFAWSGTLIRYGAATRTSTWGMMRSPDISGYLVIGVVLAIAAAALALARKVNRYLLLLLAAMFYPYGIQLASAGIFSPDRIGTDLLRMPTPGHLALLFAPPLLLACGGILTAATRRRPRTVMSADPET